jgi:shikimate kinase
LLERLLIILTGPVGGGKTTVTLALAERLREIGRPTSVIDLDLIYCMARQENGFADQNVWRTARRGAAALADVLFDSDVSVVIVEGGFFTPGELGALYDHITSSVQLRLITLDVSLMEAFRRAQTDPNPDRVVSRNRAIYQRLYAQFKDALPFLQTNSMIVNANQLSPIELARLISDSVLAKLEGEC